MVYRPMGGLGRLPPLLFVVFAVAAVVLVRAVIRGEGPPVWFAVSWLAALGWQAYWLSFRVCVEVRVNDSVLEWSAPLRRGRVPLVDVTRIRASRRSRQLAAIEVLGRRPLLVPVRYGFGQLQAAIVARAPQVVVDQP